MEKKRGIDSFTLHILAMLFMLCDHLWADTISSTGMDDMRREDLLFRFSHL